jgi:hypothetical protein
VAREGITLPSPFRRLWRLPPSPKGRGIVGA